MMATAHPDFFGINDRYGYSSFSKINFFLFVPTFACVVVGMLLYGGPFVWLSFSSIVFPVLPFLAFSIELYSRDRSEKTLRLIAQICTATPLLTALAYYKTLDVWIFAAIALSLLMLVLFRKFRLLVFFLLCFNGLLIVLFWALIFMVFQ